MRAGHMRVLRKSAGHQLLPAKRRLTDCHRRAPVLLGVAPLFKLCCHIKLWFAGSAVPPKSRGPKAPSIKVAE